MHILIIFFFWGYGSNSWQPAVTVSGDNWNTDIDTDGVFNADLLHLADTDLLHEVCSGADSKCFHLSGSTLYLSLKQKSRPVE